MKAIVYNDSTKCHNGCKAVMEYLYSDLELQGVEVIEKNFSGINPKYKAIELKRANAIIINGEGSLHHNYVVPRWYVQIIKDAKKLGLKVYLINTVWQEMKMDPELVEALKDSYVSVREKYSAQEFWNHGIDAKIHLDLSYFRQPPVTDRQSNLSTVLIGTFFLHRESPVTQLSILKESWGKMIEVLKDTGYFITGRHHEMYAACSAKCPVFVLESNTWKNQGLFATAGVNIPFASMNASDQILKGAVDKMKKAEGEYHKLFEWMENQPKFTFKGLI